LSFCWKADIFNDLLMAARHSFERRCHLDGFATAGWTSKVGGIVCGETRAAAGRAGPFLGGGRLRLTFAQTFPRRPLLPIFAPKLFSL